MDDIIPSVPDLLEELKNWKDEQAIVHSCFPGLPPSRHSAPPPSPTIEITNTDGETEAHNGDTTATEVFDRYEQFQDLLYNLEQKLNEIDKKFLGGEAVWGTDPVEINCYVLTFTVLANLGSRESYAQVYLYGRADLNSKSMEARSMEWIQQQIAPWKTPKNKWTLKAKVSDGMETITSFKNEEDHYLSADFNIEVVGHRDGRVKQFMVKCVDYLAPFRHYYLLGTVVGGGEFALSLPVVLQSPDKTEMSTQDGLRMFSETLLFYQSQLPPEPLSAEALGKLGTEAKKRGTDVSYQAIVEERRKLSRRLSPETLVDILSQHFLYHAKVQPESKEGEEYEGLDEGSKKHLTARLRKIAHQDPSVAAIEVNWHLFSAVGVSSGEGEEFSFGTWLYDVLYELRTNDQFRDTIWNAKLCLGFVDVGSVREKLEGEEGPVVAIIVADKLRNSNLLLVYKEKESTEVKEVECSGGAKAIEMLRREELAEGSILLRGGGEKNKEQVKTVFANMEIAEEKKQGSHFWKISRAWGGFRNRRNTKSSSDENDTKK